MLIHVSGMIFDENDTFHHINKAGVKEKERGKRGKRKQPKQQQKKGVERHRHK